MRIYFEFTPTVLLGMQFIDNLNYNMLEDKVYWFMNWAIAGLIFAVTRSTGWSKSILLLSLLGTGLYKIS